MKGAYSLQWGCQGSSWIHSHLSEDPKEVREEPCSYLWEESLRQKEQQVQRPWGCSLPRKFQGQGAGQCGWRGVVRESRWGPTMQDLWTTVRTLSFTLGNTLGAPGGC